MINNRYLFRGKRIDNGEWIQGSYKWKIEEDIEGNEFAVHSIWDGLEYFVDGSTIEQCTGVLDKNGKLIFEGDIIEDGLDRKGVIKWDIDLAGFVSEFIAPVGIHKKTILNTNAMQSSMLSILGTVHDAEGEGV